MKIFITGVAGFIGSSLAERFIKLGYKVKGVDCFHPYYKREYKEENLKALISHKNFEFIEAKLQALSLKDILKDVDYIFHHSAFPGVRGNWDKLFKQYIEENILVTQKLLEETKELKNIKKIIYASSSSVYGTSNILPLKETDELKPLSPYGISKLAAEKLCWVYFKNFNLPIISLRYFTVYGPRQRPDMAFYKFIKAIINEEEVMVYGDGNQTRDFTYIEDVIETNILAMGKAFPGEVFNIGGGTKISINKAINLLEKIINKKAKIKYLPKEKGEAKDTLADINKAAKFLGYCPKTKLEKGLEKEYKWIKNKN